MNGELENLKEQLKEVQSKLDALKEEKAKLDELKKNGNFSNNLQEYYDSISKAILASENIITKIEEKINSITSKKENNSYRLSKGMIPYSTIDVYRQVAKVEQPKVEQSKGNISESDVVIDLDSEDFAQPNKDYLKKDRKMRIAQDAIIAALLVGIGAVSFKLIDAIQDRQKNKVNNTIEQPVVNIDTNPYDYESNTVVIPESTPSNPFINVIGYNEAYLKDYESTKELYNTTAEDAVEYVNDAYKILETRFYGDEATIDDIINVIVAISIKFNYRQLYFWCTC